MENKKLLVIGITGGLAAGKSTVSAMFSKSDALVLDADKIAHKALWRNSSLYGQIVGYFGKNITGKCGRIIKSKLAEIAFKNKKNQKALCGFTHPYVFDYVQRKIDKYRKKNDKMILVVEAALLIESGLYKKMDKVILVRAPIERRLERVERFRNMDREKAEQRIKYQLTDERKIKYADYVVDNQHAFKNTEKQVKKIIKELIKTKK